MLINLILATITILLCFFFLFRVAFNDFLMSPIDNENPKLKLAIRRGTPLTLRNDAIETPPLVYV